jgi:hypothetical protein
MYGGWCRLRVAEVVCQNFADELSFTFTVRWRGGKARLFPPRTDRLGVQQTSALVFDSWGGRPHLCRLAICNSRSLILPRACSCPQAHELAIKSIAGSATSFTFTGSTCVSALCLICASARSPSCRRRRQTKFQDSYISRLPNPSIRPTQAC